MLRRHWRTSLAKLKSWRGIVQGEFGAQGMQAKCRDGSWPVVNEQLGRETYKPPKANTPINPTFCRLGISSLHVGIIGKNKVTISPIIFATALLYQNAVKLIHCPGTPFRSQARGIGVHWKIVATMLANA